MSRKKKNKNKIEKLLEEQKLQEHEEIIYCTDGEKESANANQIKI